MKACLYVFIGPSGVGKSSVSRAIAKTSTRFVRVIKETTRELRADDDDVRQIPYVDLRGNNKYLAYLLNGGIRYLIDLDDVQDKLVMGISQLLIVNNPMTIRMLRYMLRGQDVRTIFVHRDMDQEDLADIFRERGLIGDKLTTAVESRLSTRNVLYHQLASGVLDVDHVIINSTIQSSVEQFMCLHDSVKHSEDSEKGPLLNIIVAGTGPAKDQMMRLVESIPGGYCFIVPKHLTRRRRQEDGAETINVDEIPSDCLKYNFFTHEYGVNPKTVREVLLRHRLGFVTISRIPVAQELKRVVEAWGMRARIVYLHQKLPDLSGYETSVAQMRRAHTRQLLHLYQEELIEESGLSVVLAENEDILCSYVHRMYVESLDI